MSASAPLDAAIPRRVVVMGVAASGKSSVAASLAARLGFPVRDADDLHPHANVEKMRAGTPLADDDRWPWLDAVGDELARADDGLVIACSALRRAYRDRLRAKAPDTVFVHLTGSPDLLAERATARAGHFMPASLLDSQLRTLEPLEADERGTAVDVAGSVDEIAGAAADWVRASGA